MTAVALWKVDIGGDARLARGDVSSGPAELLSAGESLDGLLSDPSREFADVLDAPAEGAVPEGARILAPIGSQEVWCAGVTYLRSRDARKAESLAPDHYDRVYDAERPEIFFKANGERVRGPGETIGVRDDSTWDVPEPELGVLLDSGGRVAAYTIGNDVSSRSIEGENPLYLPQAKVYRHSCAVGPCLVPAGQAPSVDDMEITLSISRGGESVFSESLEVATMKRTVGDLADWLFRAQDFPRGVLLLTGTAIVPATEFTLLADDEVAIAITGLGELRNRVEIVDARPAATGRAGDPA